MFTKSVVIDISNEICRLSFPTIESSELSGSQTFVTPFFLVNIFKKSGYIE